MQEFKELVELSTKSLNKKLLRAQAFISDVEDKIADYREPLEVKSQEDKLAKECLDALRDAYVMLGKLENKTR